MIIWFITSLLVLLGFAQAAHLVTLISDRSLQTYTAFCGAAVVAGIFVCAGLGIFFKIKNKRRFCISREFSPYMLLFVLLSAVTLAEFQRGCVPDLRDAVYELALGNLESGSIMSVHPFTGRNTQAVMPFRMQILGLSSLYSALSYVTGVSLYTLLCKIIPCFIWCCSLLLYYVYAQKLFSNDIHKRWIFMSLIAFFYLITAQSEGLLGYQLFHAGFSGETIRSVLLLPYTLLVSWQKKWHLAVLAVIIEACLVWTTYGAGYCMCIAVCMFVVHVISDRGL